MENEDIIVHCWDEFTPTCSAGIKHDPCEVLQRNAQFLIDSSKKIDGYDSEVIKGMQEAYARESYDQVIDLAYRYDRQNRFKEQQSPLVRFRQFFQNVISLLK